MIVQVCFVRQEERFAAEVPEAAAFGSPAARRGFATGRAALRRLLSAELGFVPEIRIGPNGKPETDGVYFNLSHSGDWVAVALCREAAVGVDLERIDLGRDLLRLARRFLEPAVVAEVEARGAPAFYRAWARREAHAKCLGLGALATFSPDDGCTLFDLAAPEGYVAALAVRSGTPSIRYRPLPP